MEYEPLGMTVSAVTSTTGTPDLRVKVRDSPNNCPNKSEGLHKPLETTPFR